MCCLLSACESLRPNDGLLESQAVNAHVSSQQLRVLVNEFASHAAQSIEQRADQILSETQEPEVRKNALLWKINGISACYQAASRNDALAAYLDVWILNRQMLGLIASPSGYQLFWQWQPIVVDECHELDLRLQRINQIVGTELALGDLWVGEDFVANFAAEFPVANLYLVREPMASRYLEHVKEPKRELLQVVANLDANLVELKKLSTQYAAHLPKQARWEAELFVLDSTQLEVVRGPLQDFSRVSYAVAGIASAVQTLPQVVANEHRAMQELAEGERTAVLLAIERMRENTVEQLEGERAIVLDALRQERREVLGALQGERIAVTQQLSRELNQALQAADTITQERTAEIVAQSPDVIDHFFLRLGQLLGVLGLAALLSLWWISRNRGARVRQNADTDVQELSLLPLPTSSQKAA